MPREARLVVPGYLYHVTQRGNYRQRVFEEDVDRVTYLKYVDQKSREYGVAIYAFCLMDNHVHFLLQPQRDGSLGELFRAAHMKYAHYFNRKKGLKGHLWQGRFYSCLVNGAHITETFRYIENNPVRARMVKQAWHYAWSSARAHLGLTYKIIRLADAGEFIVTSDWKGYLCRGEDAAFVRRIRELTRKGLVLASDAFIDKMEQDWGVRVRRNRPGRPKIVSVPNIPNIRRAL